MLTEIDHKQLLGLEMVIHGGRPLRGTINISGSKHSALHILGAILLRDGEYLFEDFPAICDTLEVLQIYRSMGVTTHLQPRKARITVDQSEFCYKEQELYRAGHLRSSILLLGSLLARHGYVSTPVPSGDDFGSRPIDEFLAILDAFGIRYRYGEGRIQATLVKPLEGDRIIRLDAVGDKCPGNNRTALAIILAAANRGKTTIVAPLETLETSELLAFLEKCGVIVALAVLSDTKMSGHHSAQAVTCRVIDIYSGGIAEFRKSTGMVRHTLAPDKCELIFWACAAGLTDGSINCHINAESAGRYSCPLRMGRAASRYLQPLGISAAMWNTGISPNTRSEVPIESYRIQPDGAETPDRGAVITFASKNDPSPIDIVVGYYNRDEEEGIIADAFPQLIPLMMAATGQSTYTDRKFGAARLRTYWDLLGLSREESAEQSSTSDTIEIRGGHRFCPGEHVARNIRDGAAKLLYSLRAPGRSKLVELRHVLRGYESMADKLRSVGAHIDD